MSDSVQFFEYYNKNGLTLDTLDRWLKDKKNYMLVVHPRWEKAAEVIRKYKIQESGREIPSIVNLIDPKMDEDTFKLAFP